MSNFATWMSQGLSMTVSASETVEVFSHGRKRALVLQFVHEKR
jgi:hypothetical protein